jgi:hypothetical protein
MKRHRTPVLGGVRGKLRCTHEHATCKVCELGIYAPIGETLCTSCKLVSLGARRKGYMPSGGRLPQVALHGTVLVQECTGGQCGAMFWPSDSLDAQGRCVFCLLPGDYHPVQKCKTVLAGTPGHGGLVHFLRHQSVLTAECNDYGQVYVWEVNQTTGRRTMLVRMVSERPMWGTGWDICVPGGASVPYLSNWDSSD